MSWNKTQSNWVKEKTLTGVYFICEGREFALKASPKALYFRFIKGTSQPKDIDGFHHYQWHSYRIKSVQAVIICCLLQLKPQQITQQNLMFLQLKGNYKLGMEKQSGILLRWDLTFWFYSIWNFPVLQHKPNSKSCFTLNSFTCKFGFLPFSCFHYFVPELGLGWSLVLPAQISNDKHLISYKPRATKNLKIRPSASKRSIKVFLQLVKYEQSITKIKSLSIRSSIPQNTKTPFHWNLLHIYFNSSKYIKCVRKYLFLDHRIGPSF